MKADIPFALVQALIRCAISNEPTDAVKHQVNRIINYLGGSGHGDAAIELMNMITPNDGANEAPITRTNKTNPND